MPMHLLRASRLALLPSLLLVEGWYCVRRAHGSGARSHESRDADAAAAKPWFSSLLRVWAADATVCCAVALCRLILLADGCQSVGAWGDVAELGPALLACLEQDAGVAVEACSWLLGTAFSVHQGLRSETRSSKQSSFVGERAWLFKVWWIAAAAVLVAAVRVEPATFEPTWEWLADAVTADRRLATFLAHDDAAKLAASSLVGAVLVGLRGMASLVGFALQTRKETDQSIKKPSASGSRQAVAKEGKAPVETKEAADSTTMQSDARAVQSDAAGSTPSDTDPLEPSVPASSGAAIPPTAGSKAHPKSTKSPHLASKSGASGDGARGTRATATPSKAAVAHEHAYNPTSTRKALTPSKRTATAGEDESRSDKSGVAVGEALSSKDSSESDGTRRKGRQLERATSEAEAAAAPEPLAMPDPDHTALEDEPPSDQVRVLPAADTLATPDPARKALEGEPPSAPSVPKPLDWPIGAAEKRGELPQPPLSVDTAEELSSGGAGGAGRRPVPRRGRRSSITALIQSAETRAGGGLSGAGKLGSLEVVDVEEAASESGQFDVDVTTLVFAIFEHYAARGDAVHGNHLTLHKFCSIVKEGGITRDVEGLRNADMELLFVSARDSEDTASASPRVRLAGPAHDRELDFTEFVNVLSIISERMYGSPDISRLAAEYLLPLAETAGGSLLKDHKDSKQLDEELVKVRSPSVAALFKSNRSTLLKIFKWYAQQAAQSRIASRASVDRRRLVALSFDELVTLCKDWDITRLANSKQIKCLFDDIKTHSRAVAAAFKDTVTSPTHAAPQRSPAHTARTPRRSPTVVDAEQYQDLISFNEFVMLLGLLVVRFVSARAPFLSHATESLFQHMQVSRGREKLMRTRDGVIISHFALPKH